MRRGPSATPRNCCNARGLRSVDVNAPAGLALRSAGLATRNDASPTPFRRFFRFSAARPAGRAAEKRKKRRTTIEGWPVVVNPALCWGKPSRGGRVAFK